MTYNEIKNMAIKKATQSKCTFKVSAIGLNKNGDVIAKSVNKKRFLQKGGGIHAEMQIMKKPGVKTIYICRTNSNGDVRPIDPCNTCKRKANLLKIEIISIRGL
jgi:hypothetical protein